MLFIRGIRMVGVDNFTLDGTKDETDADVMASFIKQFYESATYVPQSVVVPFALPEQTSIAELAHRTPRHERRTARAPSAARSGASSRWRRRTPARRWIWHA